MSEVEVDEMHEIVNLHDDQIQYVLNDTEFVLESPQLKSDLNDVVYSLVLDGDNLNQFYINNDNEQIYVDSNVIGDNTPVNGTIIQYVDDEEEAVDEQQQVVYITDANEVIPDPESDLSQYEQFEINTNNEGEPIKGLLPNYIGENDELLGINGGLSSEEQLQGIEVDAENPEGYQFAILKDGKLYYIQSNDNNELVAVNNDSDAMTVIEDHQNDESVDDPENVSNIFGKNLLTGQTVRLDGYMNNLQQKANIQFAELQRNAIKKKKAGLKRKRPRADDLTKLLNTKINLGKTSSGKTLIGKVIHVEKKSTEKKAELKRNVKRTVNLLRNKSMKSNLRKFDFLTQNDSQVESSGRTGDKPLKLTTVSQECKEDVIRTLSGLMNMATVRKKLENKLISVMMIEKRRLPSNELLKQTSYSRGILKDEEKVNDEGEKFTHWRYFAKEDLNEEQAILFNKETEGMESISITLIVSYETNGDRNTRVVLNTPVIMPHCKICNEDFVSNFLLHCHIKNFHNIGNGPVSCQVCHVDFENDGNLNEHIELHLNEGLLHQCEFCRTTFLDFESVRNHVADCAIGNKDATALLDAYVCRLCKKQFCNEVTLKKHSFYHIKPRPFLCNLCGKYFKTRQGLNSHRRSYGTVIRTKYFSCTVCNRGFSRHSNLQRHMEIHTGKGALYECHICGCSYHYASSLTRHMVQNHLDVVTEQHSTPAYVEINSLT